MTLAPTPWFIVGSNELNNSLMEPNSAQYIWNKIWT
jgi:hypothetical protein